jgi:hypothetical protein
VRHNDGAILAEGFVAAGVIAMEMRIDDIADRLRRDGGDGWRMASACSKQPACTASAFGTVQRIARAM